MRIINLKKRMTSKIEKEEPQVSILMPNYNCAILQKLNL